MLRFYLEDEEFFRLHQEANYLLFKADITRQLHGEEQARSVYREAGEKELEAYGKIPPDLPSAPLWREVISVGAVVCFYRAQDDDRVRELASRFLFEEDLSPRAKRELEAILNSIRTMPGEE